MSYPGAEAIDLAAVVRLALRLAPTHDATLLQRAALLGDDRALALAVLVVVEIQHNPVVHTAELVRARRVREQRCEVPGAAARMQHGQP